ncbi:MAG TPA: DNA-formamidopyrimidine glycosylase family protein, partial [Bryobacteraceae bacterium]|nr:DNA-formamidopyrimidine glycosylase family protein [Bryobacteraceae bacterium]
MPELPEVEAVVARIRRVAKGRTIREVEVLRSSAVRPQTPALVASRAIGRRIDDVRRRGKNILIELAGGFTIRIHLKLTGELHAGEVNRSSRVVFHLSGSKQLVFDEPWALGTVNVLDRDKAREGACRTRSRAAIARVHRGWFREGGSQFASAREAVSHGSEAGCRPWQR